ncbi:MAG TPA: hypothetical protein V6C58_25045 [Allocoleopsis sp.]
MKEWELEQKDIIPIFKTQSMVTNVLNEKIKLTLKHIEKLADLFHVSPAVFLPKKSNL